MWKFRLLLSLLLVAAVQAHALTVVPVDVATQVDRAELIFVGKVVEVRSVPVTDGSFAYTYVTFDVEETLKGAAAAPLLTLRFDGGEAGGFVYEIAGAPKFKAGGRHLLFVEGNDRYMMPLTGGPQGKLDLVAHPVTQEPIVVDGAGHAIGGLEEKNWSRSGLQLDRGGAIRRPQSAARVVSAEGVKVEIEEEVVKESAPAASEVLGELRALIQSRTFAPEFKRAAAVQSASPANVPDTSPDERFRRAAEK